LVIAFDTWILDRRYRNTGMNTYADHLFREFRRIAAELDGITIRFFSRNSLGNGNGCRSNYEAHATPGFDVVQAEALRFPLFWRLSGVAAAAARAGADMIFSPALHISPFAGVPVVSTIHDVIPARLPHDQFARGTALKRGVTTRATIRLSNKIVTDSECSRSDLIQVYGVPPEKIAVVYLGYDKTMFNAVAVENAALSAIRERHGIGRPYILHHGMVQRRKNLSRLIEAYDSLIGQKQGFDFDLVLAGPHGWGAQEICSSAALVKGRGKVIFTGPLPDRELAVLIKGASLAVIPSLYEGFCLPLLEAMACGIPVVASNSSCLPEVSGGRLRYFDPFSIDDIGNTILSVLGDSDLQRRLALDGLKRAAEFSWERCARETLAVLRNAVVSTNGSGKRS
jgi:glycosyltransferase involved in cell wall biosynthesis